jgi:hypothetical protein
LLFFGLQIKTDGTLVKNYRIVFYSVADPHRKNADADADPGKNLNADPDADADSCPY